MRPLYTCAVGRLRVWVAGLLLALSVVGCASGGEDEAAEGSAPGSLEALWKAPGEDVGLIQGTSDYAPGTVRVSFLVIRKDGSPVERPHATVWVARDLKAKPFERTTARLESMSAGSGHGDEHGLGGLNLYVTHVSLPRSGKFWLLAEPVGGSPIQGLATLVVKPTEATPGVGDRAVRSRTPTIASARGDFSRLTTADPPDRELLGYSVAESLAARTPFVLVFATPKFCSSRTCGPTVAVVDGVRKQFAGSGVRFIHVEIYRDNDPQRGVNRWVKEWNLPSEPWVFVVGRDGRIKAKFEGSVSVRELAPAVRKVI